METPGFAGRVTPATAVAANPPNSGSAHSGREASCRRRVTVEDCTNNKISVVGMTGMTRPGNPGASAVTPILFTGGRRARR
jgi:hypothetical protein